MNPDPNIHHWLTLYKCRWCNENFKVVRDFSADLFTPESELADMRRTLLPDSIQEHECGEGRVGAGEPIGFRQFHHYEVPSDA